jgi:GDPmannose 4,6-dehydratase
MNSIRFSFDGRQESEAEYQARIKHRNSGYANNFNKKALITGVTGQDGSYLAELLLEKGYRVVGLKRRTSTENYQRIESCIKNPRFTLEEVEVADSGSVYCAVDRHQPDEIYNLAAQSHVKTSFDQPHYTIEANTVGVVNFLEAIRRFKPDAKFYQASTSEMFGKNYDTKFCTDDKKNPQEKFQDEETVFEPQSPYAAAKLASHHMVRIYREAYGLHASCGILFNHESERRGEKFVTRKITKWIAGFKSWAEVQGLDTEARHFDFDKDHIHSRRSLYPKLRLGNIEAFRDWGHAEDYVNAMWLMLQQNIPDDYVIATGETHSVYDFMVHAFDYINISKEEIKDFFVIDPEFYRPAEVEFLKGDPTKAQTILGWDTNISFEQLVHRMLESDINAEKTKTQEEFLS